MGDKSSGLCPKDLNCGCMLCSEEDDDIYTLCQWQIEDGPSAIYLVYRVLVALYFMITWVTVIVLKNELIFYHVHSLLPVRGSCYVDNLIITCTFLGYTFTMLEKLWATVAVMGEFGDSSFNEYYLRSYWIYLGLQTIGQNFSMVVLLVYFTIYAVLPDSKEYFIIEFIVRRSKFNPMAVLMYLMYFIINIIDAVIVAHTIPLGTFYVSFFALLFIIFVIYMDFLAGQRRCVTGYNSFFTLFGKVYHTAEGGLTFGMSLVWVLLAHVLFWLLQTLRDLVYAAFIE